MLPAYILVDNADLPKKGAGSFAAVAVGLHAAVDAAAVVLRAAAFDNDKENVDYDLVLAECAADAFAGVDADFAVKWMIETVTL